MMTPAWIAYPEWATSALLWGFIAMQGLFVVGHLLRGKYWRLFGWKAPFYALRNSLPMGPVYAYLWGALVLMLAPMWWSSVFAVYLAERYTSLPSLISLTPTRVFLLAVISFYAAWYLHGVFGRRRNRKFRHLRETDEQPPAVRKRVAVIGAGMAGLVTAKELKEEGHEVVVFEKGGGWGGVWAQSKARGGRAWRQTMTSTGSLNTTFSDSPFPIYHEQNGDTPLHYTREQFHAMLVDYEQRYGVFEGSLRTHQELVGLEALPGERWRLTVRDTDTGAELSEEFDALTFCTGLNHEPWTPEVPGQGHFRGEEIHVNDYDPKTPEKYAGKRVVVVGTGETASDLVKDLMDNGAEHVYISRRSPTLMLPRNNLSQPPDYVESRLAYGGPMLHRWAILFGAGAPMWFPVMDPQRTAPPSSMPWPWFNMMFGIYNPLKLFPAMMAGVNVTKSDYLWMALGTSRASLISKLRRITADGVTTIDDSEYEVDAIIYCTGYRTENDLIPKPTRQDGSTVDSPTTRDMYKMMVHPDHPTLAMIGFCRGLVGAITVSAEMQARWWALLVSGKRTLPSAPEMKRHIAYLNKHGSKYAQPTRTTMTYANSLARHDVGCEPDMFRLFFDDRKLWWTMLNGAVCNAHYRLHGVHAKPELAKEQLSMEHALHEPDYIDSIDVAYNIIPLCALVIPLYHVAGKLLPTFQLESSMGSYI